MSRKHTASPCISQCTALQLSGRGVGEVSERIGPPFPPIDREQVVRYMGYPTGVALNPRFRGVMDKWVDEAQERATPQAVYSVFEIDVLEYERLSLRRGAETVEFVGDIGQYLAPSRSVVAFIATAGLEVEDLSKRLVDEGEDLAGLVVDAVGAERAETAEAAVMNRLRERYADDGLAPTLPYSPGYCGMSLREQQKLFELFEGQTAGVTLSESCLMQPLKSISGLVGLAPADEVSQLNSPCDRCDFVNCHMRR